MPSVTSRRPNQALGGEAAATSQTLFRLLLRCAEQKNLQSGSSLHAHIIKSGSWAHVLLANSVVNMYAKCGRLATAAAAFDEMHSRDVVSWNSLINSYSHEGPPHSNAVFRLFKRMRADGGVHVLPNAFTFAGVFTAASASHAVLAGREAHCVAIKTANCDDVFLGSSLLNMYCKLGLLSDARMVFDRMLQRNSVSWAAMISGYAVDKHGAEAFKLFRSMLEEGECDTNEFVFTSILSAVSLPGLLEMGQQIHGLAIKNGLSSFLSVENSLITLYAKCERMDEALLMFESSSEKNSITWSAMITGYAQNGDSRKALSLFSQMQSAGIRPSEFTFVGVLNACSDVMALVEGKQAHGFLLKLGFELQVYVKTALVDMYAKCGSSDDARKGFDQLHEADIALWTSMIGGYVQNGEHEEALALYCGMGREGILPNNLTMASILRACSSLAALEQGKQIHAQTLKYGFNLGIPIGSALSTMYAKCGNLEDCNRVFRRMPERDVVAWNSIISGYSQNGCGNEALNLFEEMKLEGTKPDHVTFINLLSACSHMGLVDRGWSYFRLMHDDYGLVPRVEHYACMVDILSRAGMLEEAKDFVESVPTDHGMCLWRIVLGACRSYRSFGVGAYAGERLMELGSLDSSAYILLSNIYAACRRWDDVERVRRMMRFRGVNKEPGCSWIEIKSRVHAFVVGDLQHPEMKDIHAEVRRLLGHMTDEGYRPASGFPVCDYLESDLGGHQTREELQLIASAAS
ncbi:pentatricopeptide repeat-containing protein At2g33680 [Phoenix dactylifera]|uniref:Pentatricopeptide repeat-containing protein At2g33680 n=1 Tax=Phoenix dactylifera TaxID=42345 RepID=A0A8B7CTG1_PHODC|nr:pentatricopeptide repeat-containing protein At2g33680 [Phoenix dactylifera]